MSEFLARYYKRAKDLPAWLEGGVYELDECVRCALVFQRFVGDDALLEQLYDRWLDPRGDLAPGKDEAPHLDDPTLTPAQTRDGHELFAVASALGRPVHALRVLDYGMGWGLWASTASRLGAQAFGYDLAESRRAFASALGVTAISDAAEAPGLGLDFVNTEQVLEHVAEPSTVVDVLAASLRPGGILKISVPCALGIAARSSSLDWSAPIRTPAPTTPVHPLEHVNCFGRRSLAALAARSGLTPMPIPLRSYFAFAVRPSAIPTRPRALAKAIARPLYHRLSRHNLYMWFRRAI